MAMDMNRMMKQARKMQADLAKAQEEISQQEFSATAGGGAVEAVVSGSMRLVSLKIDPDAASPEDVEMLQDMVMAAVNEALGKVEQVTSDRMGALTGGLNIPGLM